MSLLKSMVQGQLLGRKAPNSTGMGGVLCRKGTHQRAVIPARPGRRGSPWWAALQCMCGGSVTSAGLLQSTSSWHQRLWNTSAVMVGCLAPQLGAECLSRQAPHLAPGCYFLFLIFFGEEETLYDSKFQQTDKGNLAVEMACVGCSGRDLAVC